MPCGHSGTTPCLHRRWRLALSPSQGSCLAIAGLMPRYQVFVQISSGDQKSCAPAGASVADLRSRRSMARHLSPPSTKRDQRQQAMVKKDHEARRDRAHRRGRYGQPELMGAADLGAASRHPCSRRMENTSMMISVSRIHDGVAWARRTWWCGRSRVAGVEEEEGFFSNMGIARISLPR